MSRKRPQASTNRATNVSVRSDLLDAARAANINLSATLEDALSLKLKVAAAGKWREENEAAIANYNDFVEQHGVLPVPAHVRRALSR